jgi:CheY-like chemotaxis protein
LARKILLADDSVTAQNMGRKILADAGYEVIAVNNGSAALKKIAELKPDLVILDVYMPGYSGLEVCQRLKESPETARIPVLLSVGKLEPFKPEEAQRVRADAYIVKPFEASELLSALSKLEDKVVPRAEPSKPGRFARAMAAAEETSRGSRKETASEQTGWSSRIGFPHEKVGPAEKVADDSAIYNPMNRDLRTVVETAAERAAGKNAEIQTENKEETRAPAAKVDEAIVDVAALTPAGLPKDVTPEEVAAITAAVAQIHMAGAAVEDEHQTFESGSSAVQIPETQIPETQIPETRIPETQVSEAAETASQGSLEPPSDRVEDNVAPPVRAEFTAETPQGSKIDELVSEVTATEVNLRVNGDVRAEQTQDLPVTMAAATAETAAATVGASRWTAVPVALEGEEATVSLEEEMQKAYAVYAPYVAAEGDSGGVAAVQTVEAVTPDHSSSIDVVPLVEASPVENASSPEVVPVEVDAVTAAAAKFVEPNLGFASVAESVAPAAKTEVDEFPVAESAVAESASQAPPQAQEAPPWPESEPAMAEAATASSADFASAANADEDAEELKPDFEAVKSTAAAWASWRQIRDTRKDEVTQTPPKEFEVPEPLPAEIAAAVAAGAEQTLQTAPAAPNSDPADVASIVESVLANLRPKLMEEISRKMAEKK